VGIVLRDRWRSCSERGEWGEWNHGAATVSCVNKLPRWLRAITSPAAVRLRGARVTLPVPTAPRVPEGPRLPAERKSVSRSQASPPRPTPAPVTQHRPCVRPGVALCMAEQAKP
jgi:hypothetical protein